MCHDAANDGAIDSRRALQVAIIPARYESTRFPGKPLVPILGVPMIVRTYRQALKATTLDAVVVATDDERIAAVCREAGARVVMTDPACPNGAPKHWDLRFLPQALGPKA